MSDERASEEAEHSGAENGSPLNGDGANEDDAGTDPAGSESRPRNTLADPEAETEEQEVVEEPSELEKAITERNRMKDQLLRIAADFDNFRKRSRREIEDARRRAQQDTILDVLPVIDNLERAADAANNANDVQAVADGVKMVLRGFEDVAGRLGIKRIEVVGERFDPNLHDAMQQQETNEHPPGTIVAEIVPGYTIGDRLLRPAMVVVARPPAPVAPAVGSEAPGPASEPPEAAADASESESEEQDDVVFIEDGTPDGENDVVPDDDAEGDRGNGSTPPSRGA